MGKFISQQFETSTLLHNLYMHEVSLIILTLMVVCLTVSLTTGQGDLNTANSVSLSG